MRNIMLFMCVLSLLVLAGPAWGDTAYTWDDGAGDHEWSTQEAGPVTNWSPEGIPDYDTVPEPAIRDTATINSGYAAVISLPGARAYNVLVGTDGTSIGTLAINGIDGTQYLYSDRMSVREGSTFTLNHGTSKIGWGCLNVNAGGTFNVNGGIFDAYNTHSAIVISGDFIQTGGEVGKYGGQSAVNGDIRIYGKYKISGGKVWPVTNSGHDHCVVKDGGVLQVSGLWDIPGENEIEFATAYTQETGGMLLCEIDAAGSGVTKIHVDKRYQWTPTGGYYPSGVATFEADSILKMGLLGAAPALGTSFDLLTAYDGQDEDEIVVPGSIVDNGLKWAPMDAGFDPADWTFAFIDTNADGTNDTLRVTYIPEPATLAMLGVGLVGVVLRRRRC